jgi:predicted transposase YdaD
MAKPFDVTSKYLLELAPRDWLEYAQLPVKDVEVINANLEIVIAEADKVLRVTADRPYIAHFELQASYDPEIANRMLKYNVLLRERHRLPVASALLLLRPEADGSAVSGSLELSDETGNPALRFSYHVIRAWLRPVEEVLRGGLFALPLALVSDLSGTTPEAVIDRLSERYDREATSSMSADLWTTTYVLLGLRSNESAASNLLRGVRSMQESATYRAIVEKGKAEGKAEGKVEGKAEEAQKMLLLVGSRRLGLPSHRTQQSIERLNDVEVIEKLVGRTFDVETWEELLK